MDRYRRRKEVRCSNIEGVRGLDVVILKELGG